MTKRIATATAPKGFTRRDFLASSALTAGLLAAARTLFPVGAMAEGKGPEVTGAKLNAAYKALSGHLAPADQQRLRDAQRAWIPFRD
ncbi:DUF1311 domain-containing protein, partial [Mesorhizobium sp. M4B.F.Ca.ET.215.01.1.1]|uniref:lysozyme inhibitor LprI family protein n=1 Tax=Mesorhizobium sp. M4B.F.Ca.ET.215.01.1.1 TaxID=2563956 RepID=UPI0010933A05